MTDDQRSKFDDLFTALNRAMGAFDPYSDDYRPEVVQRLDDMRLELLDLTRGLVDAA